MENVWSIHSTCIEWKKGLLQIDDIAKNIVHVASVNDRLNKKQQEIENHWALLLAEGNCLRLLGSKVIIVHEK